MSDEEWGFFAPFVIETGPRRDRRPMYHRLVLDGVFIPPKRNRKVQPVIDGHLYALRNLVERCFSKLKHSRRLAIRYDKTADSYIGFILIASTRLWVRHFINRT